MEPILALFYLALFAALLFFGPLQEYLQKKKSEWDTKKSAPEQKADERPAPADPERMGLVLSVVLIALAMAFLLWKILTTS